MSEFERKDLTATLFENDYKEQEKHPDWKGEALINNEKFFISGWDRSTSQSKPYISISFQTEEEAKKYRKNKDEVQKQTNKSDKSDNSDLPF
tara:strand:- start:255 stop:530 length:276 start_codon:yes stop_codon:yes gene_type:complete